jgi:DeoR/GlpR family transcriptional regulator of sugar metabolism
VALRTVLRRLTVLEAAGLITRRDGGYALVRHPGRRPPPQAGTDIVEDESGAGPD